MRLAHMVTHTPVAIGEIVTSRDQQVFTLRDFDEEFVYVTRDGERARERYRPQFFGLVRKES